MPYVHHCVFCGWSRPATSTTLLSPACEACGCTLRATTAERFARGSAEVTRPNLVRPSRKTDVTAAFAVLVAVPMMLPIAGVDCSGTQFEPEIVEALARLVEDGELTVLALRASAA